MNPHPRLFEVCKGTRSCDSFVSSVFATLQQTCATLNPHPRHSGYDVRLLVATKKHQAKITCQLAKLSFQSNTTTAAFIFLILQYYINISEFFIQL
jgi:hypothetical protein